MFDNRDFQELVAQGRPTGEVVAAERFMVEVTGLEGVPVGAKVLFEDGHAGMVREVGHDRVTVLNLMSESVPLGSAVALEDEVMTTGVGPALVGRVVSALGEPLDGKGPIKLNNTAPVFSDAPGVMERALLSDRLETGVSVVDMMFPFVMGQRLAVLGDAKSGKSAFLTQLTLKQAQEPGRVIIHVLIAKRKVDIDTLVTTLQSTGAMKNCIVVVASVFDSLVQSYLAPYIACAMGEYLWKSGRDVIMVYDDLTNHAKAYRELSLLSRVSPGRDSYPGDMFHAHSSLMERAGKLAKGGATMTALPVVVTPDQDITAFMPTNVMSMTDGQIIFDLQMFRQGIRPAVNTGLSVSRVGNLAQDTRQQKLSNQVFRKLADYRQAAQFSHFSSELALQSQANLALGQAIYEAFRQSPEEIIPLPAQQILLEAVLASGGTVALDIPAMKQKALALGKKVKNQRDLDQAVATLTPAQPKEAAA